jgi:hypothetical protein
MLKAWAPLIRRLYPSAFGPTFCISEMIHKRLACAKPHSQEAIDAGRSLPKQRNSGCNNLLALIARWILVVEH